MPKDGPVVSPAATVVVMRNAPGGGPPELLMVQRAQAMRFAGGATVFPGGRVDPADYELAERLAPQQPPELAAARVAAIRETLEETGLLIATHDPVSAADAAAARALLLGSGRLDTVLERYGWTLDLDALCLFAHWCPALLPRAFDTRFFLTDLGTGAVDLQVDGTENARLFWVTAGTALDMADRGEISVIFPTRRNLERLALYESHAHALEQIAAYPVVRIQPVVQSRPDGDWLVFPEGLGYPVTGERVDTAKRG
ncbi:NUDIX hydrolase [Novosphingobium sp. Leaf2]|uniref:NUDIX hydrolase n=1 Tax=Novosphingobium sp. Leaf2 TaxID=1735670 RepID=UPI001F3017E8|nr:NUDIX domain-containing protein [Novosphingobium sp. Leaf2]